jgi:hypothetical protein
MESKYKLIFLYVKLLTTKYKLRNISVVKTGSWFSHLKKKFLYISFKTYQGPMRVSSSAVYKVTSVANNS